MILGDTPSSVLVFMQYYMSPMDKLMEMPHMMMVFPYEEALIEAVQGGDYELTKRITWGCHDVVSWLIQANTSVGQTYFQIFNITRYMYNVFLTIRIYII